MARTLAVSVDKTLCVNNHWCIKNVGAVFSEDAAGQADVGDPSAASEAALIEAAEMCPVGAISVLDAETGADLLDD
jgi:ferredoxin